MVKRLEGKCAVVTGGGAGLGRGIALRLANEGAKVLVADLDLEAARSTAAEIQASGGSAEAFRCDVTREEDVAALARFGVSAFGKINLLCNNVGASFEARNVIRITELTGEQWDFLLNLNLKSVFLTCKHIIPCMIQAGGGSIVNITSIACSKPTFGAAYGAAKAGLVALSNAIAVQFADDGIRCNTVAPGAMRTPGGASVKKQGVFKDQASHRVRLIDRFGEPEDVGAAVAFLLSDDASFITATNLAVDGGSLTLISDIPKRGEPS